MSDQNSPTRFFPVRPDLDQLKHQAKDLLRSIRRRDPVALSEFNELDPERVKLADVQFALARSYGAASWPRLVQSCKLIDAIWRDDVDAVRNLVEKHYRMNHMREPQVAPFTQLLLDAGADPNVRASLRKRLHPGYGPKLDVEKTYEYRNVTPLGWGRQFHAKVFVSEPAMRLIEEHGGGE